MTERQLKKPKVEDIDKLTAGVTRGFHQYGHTLQSNELAQSMLASSASGDGAFHDAGIMLPDVKLLANETESEDDGSASDHTSSTGLKSKSGKKDDEVNVKEEKRSPEGKRKWLLSQLHDE